MKKKIIWIVIFFIISINCYALDTIEKKVELDYSNYSIETKDGYSIININHDTITQTEGPIVLPIGYKNHQFPIDTIIEDVELTSKENPIDFNANIPSFLDEFNERICIKNEDEVKIEDSISIGRDSKTLAIKIYPLEIIDCEQGLFRLYRNLSYTITYTPTTPLIFERKLPNRMDTDQEYTASIKIQKLDEKEIEGEIRISGDGEVWGSKEVNIDDDGIINLSFRTPNKSGSYILKVSFVIDGLEIYSKEDWVDIKGLSYDIIAPSEVVIGNPILIQVKYNKESNTSSLWIRLKKGTVTVTEKQIEQYSGESISLQTAGLETGTYIIEVSDEINGLNEMQMIKLIDGSFLNDKEKSSSKNYTKIVLLSLTSLFTIILAVVLIKLYKKR